MPSFQVFTPAQIESLRRGGAILRDCLQHVRSAVEPGMKTIDLDRLAEEFIVGRGGKPAFKGYRGFPGTLCISVNDECVHGIPGKRVLKEGDIVSLDGGVIIDDLYTDACVSVGVGTIAPAAKRLLTVTERALERAMSVLKAGVRVGDVSATVQEYVEGEGFTIVRALTGHGLGSSLHQFPDVPNAGTRGTGPVIPAGAVLAIEPIVSVSSSDVREAADGWTLSTTDGCLSAHSEHTLLVTEDGCEILA